MNAVASYLHKSVYMRVVENSHVKMVNNASIYLKHLIVIMVCDCF